jgi:uncharacterized MAPEG superfamily protein
MTELVLPVSTQALLLYAVAIAAVLIYLPFGVAGYARLKIGYDYSAPRAMFDKLPLYGKRAIWAHQNAFESFMLFAAAALMAYVTEQTSSVAAVAAIAYVIARTLYPIAYVLDIPWARSLMFGIGSLSTFTLFGLSLLSATVL